MDRFTAVFEQSGDWWIGYVEELPGAKHLVFWNPARRTVTAIPRHLEIPDILARKFCKDLDVPLPQQAI